MSGGSVLLVHPDRDREHLLAPGEELQSDLGVLTVPDDVAPGDVLETHIGERFEVRTPRLADLFDLLERTGAPMMPRDVGLLVGHTGAAAGDRVLDAGTGTGILAIALGRVGADVVTYERDPEFADVARRNVRRAGVADRVEVRTGDLLATLDRDAVGDTDDDADAKATPVASPPQGPFDVVTLDTGDAPAIVAHAPDLLVAGGFLAVYSPFVEGTREAVLAAREAGLDPTTRETIQREMDVGSRGTRPSTAGVGHTGYLTFARR